MANIPSCPPGETITTSAMIAGAALSRFRFVGANHQHAGAQADVRGATPFAYAIGEQYSVVNRGFAVVEAGAAVAIDAQVESDSVGRAATGTTNVLGRARSAAAAAGDFIIVELGDLTK